MSLERYFGLTGKRALITGGTRGTLITDGN